MPTRPQAIRYFEVKIGLGSSLDLSAGKDAEDAASGHYLIHNDAPGDVYEEILHKLAKAIHDQQDSITMLVENDKWIVRDPSYPLPTLETHIALALNTDDPKGAALDVIRKVIAISPKDGGAPEGKSRKKAPTRPKRRPKS